MFYPISWEMSRLRISNERVPDLRGDLIVCEVDGSFSPMNGSGQQIWKEAGEDELSVLRPKKPLMDYQLIQTPAFKLTGRIEKILHIKMPSFVNGSQSVKNNNLKKCYLRILQKAVDLDVKSLVLPFLGIVSSKFPTKEAVDVALAAITEFNSVKGRSDNLEEIIFFSRLTQAYDLAIVHEQYLNQNSTKGSPSTKAKPSKVPKSTNEVGKKNRTGSRAKSSVRSTKGSSRKRSVIKSSEESEESEMEDDVFEDEKEEDEEDEEEMSGIHEEDFMKKVIEEDIKEIFL